MDLKSAWRLRRASSSGGGGAAARADDAAHSCGKSAGWHRAGRCSDPLCVEGMAAENPYNSLCPECGAPATQAQRSGGPDQGLYHHTCGQDLEDAVPHPPEHEWTRATQRVASVVVLADDISLYHGTTKPFEEVDTERGELGSHWGTPEQANAVLDEGGNLDAGELLPGHREKRLHQLRHMRVIPADIDVKRPLRLRDVGHFDSASIAGQLIELGIIDRDYWWDGIYRLKDEKDQNRVLQAAIVNAGYDGVVYLNRREGIGDVTAWGTKKMDEVGHDEFETGATDADFLRAYPAAHDSYIVFEPSQIKGRWAARRAAKKVDWDQVLVLAEQARAECVLEPGEEPGGLCFDASCALFEMLRAVGYAPELVEGYVAYAADEKREVGEGWGGPHAWIELDGHVIDITGDQFETVAGEKPGEVTIVPIDRSVYLPDTEMWAAARTSWTRRATGADPAPGPFKAPWPDQIQAFMQAAYDQTVGHPFARGQRIWNDQVIFEVSPWAGGPDREYPWIISLKWIQAMEPGKGHARAALSWLTALADEYGVFLELEAKPTGLPKIPRSKLINLYKDVGFESPEKEFPQDMRRQPLSAAWRARRAATPGKRVILNDDIRVWARAAADQDDRVPSIVLSKGTSVWVVRKFRLNHGGSPELLEIKWVDESAGGATGEYGHGVVRASDFSYVEVGQMGVEVDDADSWSPFDESKKKTPGAPETPADVPGMKPADRQKKIDVLLDRWSREPGKRPQIEEQLRSIGALRSRGSVRRAGWEEELPENFPRGTVFKVVSSVTGEVGAMSEPFEMRSGTTWPLLEDYPAMGEMMFLLSGSPEGPDMKIISVDRRNFLANARMVGPGNSRAGGRQSLLRTWKRRAGGFTPEDLANPEIVDKIMDSNQRLWADTVEAMALKAMAILKREHSSEQWDESLAADAVAYVYWTSPQVVRETPIMKAVLDQVIAWMKNTGGQRQSFLSAWKRRAAIPIGESPPVEPGKTYWFEYHCDETDTSADVHLRNRSRSRVKVLKLSGDSAPDDQDALVWEVQFDDGFVAPAFDDELLDSPEQYQRSGDLIDPEGPIFPKGHPNYPRPGPSEAVGGTTEASIRSRWMCRRANDPIKKTIEVAGVKVGIEWPKGTIRTWDHLPNNDYRVKMKADYGYIRGTEGDDGEEVDVYAGPNRESTKVFVVEQLKDDGSYDEEKYMLGYDNLTEAKNSYLDHMEEEKLGSVKLVAWEKFLKLVPKSQKKEAEKKLVDERQSLLGAWKRRASSNPDLDLDLFNFQDSAIEPLPKQLQDIEESNILGIRLENAGDIFRELVWREYPDPGYIGEKVDKIRRYLTHPQMTQAMPDEAMAIMAQIANTFESLDLIGKSPILLAARDLNIALARQDVGRAATLLPVFDAVGQQRATTEHKAQSLFAQWVDRQAVRELDQSEVGTIQYRGKDVPVEFPTADLKRWVELRDDARIIDDQVVSKEWIDLLNRMYLYAATKIEPNANIRESTNISLYPDIENALNYYGYGLAEAQENLGGHGGGDKLKQAVFSMFDQAGLPKLNERQSADLLMNMAVVLRDEFGMSLEDAKARLSSLLIEYGGGGPENLHLNSLHGRWTQRRASSGEQKLIRELICTVIGSDSGTTNEAVLPKGTVVGVQPWSNDHIIFFYSPLYSRMIVRGKVMIGNQYSASVQDFRAATDIGYGEGTGYKHGPECFCDECMAIDDMSTHRCPSCGSRECPSDGHSIDCRKPGAMTLKDVPIETRDSLLDKFNRGEIDEQTLRRRMKQISSVMLRWRARRAVKDELWAPDPEIVKNTWRRYKCSVCGHVQGVSTNHLGAIMDYCKECSWAPSKGECYYPLGGRCYRKFTYVGEIDERHQDESGFWDTNSEVWKKRGAAGTKLIRDMKDAQTIKKMQQAGWTFDIRGERVLLGEPGQKPLSMTVDEARAAMEAFNATTSAPASDDYARGYQFGREHTKGWSFSDKFNLDPISDGLEMVDNNLLRCKKGDDGAELHDAEGNSGKIVKMWLKKDPAGPAYAAAEDKAAFERGWSDGWNSEASLHWRWMQHRSAEEPEDEPGLTMEQKVQALLYEIARDNESAGYVPDIEDLTREVTNFIADEGGVDAEQVDAKWVQELLGKLEYPGWRNIATPENTKPDLPPGTKLNSLRERWMRRAGSKLVNLYKRWIKRDPEAKNAWHFEASRMLEAIAREMGLVRGESYDLRSNKAGSAVMGEVTLHTDDVYVEVSGSGLMPGHEVMYRVVNGRGDFTGGPNNYMTFDDVENPKLAAGKIMGLIQKQGPSRPQPSGVKGSVTLETERGARYEVNVRGEIIRLDMKDFQPSGRWRLVGIRNPMSGVMIPFEAFSMGLPEDVQDWEVVDYDHGTKRVWGDKLRAISVSGNPPWANKRPKKAPAAKPRVRPSTGDATRMIETAIIDLLRKGPSTISRDFHELLENSTVSMDENGVVDPIDAPFVDMVSEVIGHMIDRGMIMFDGSTAEFSLLKEPEPTTPEHIPEMSNYDRQTKIDDLLDQMNTEKDPAKRKQIEQRLRSLRASVRARLVRLAGYKDWSPSFLFDPKKNPIPFPKPGQVSGLWGSVYSGQNNIEGKMGDDLDELWFLVQSDGDLYNQVQRQFAEKNPEVADQGLIALMPVREHPEVIPYLKSVFDRLNRQFVYPTWGAQANVPEPGHEGDPFYQNSGPWKNQAKDVVRILRGIYGDEQGAVEFEKFLGRLNPGEREDFIEEVERDPMADMLSGFDDLIRQQKGEPPMVKPSPKTEMTSDDAANLPEVDVRAQTDQLLEQLQNEDDPEKKKQIEQRLRSLQASPIVSRWRQRRAALSGEVR